MDNIITTNEIIEQTIALRFFHAIEALKESKKTNLTRFCSDCNLSRIKYQVLKSSTTDHKKGRYVAIDGCAMVHLCKRYGVRPAWLLMGEGNMFK